MTPYLIIVEGDERLSTEEMGLPVAFIPSSVEMSQTHKRSENRALG